MQERISIRTEGGTCPAHVFRREETGPLPAARRFPIMAPTLANDAADSPHLLVPEMKARVYVAGAIEDATFPEERKRRLTQALAAAGVDHVVKTDPARDGWVPADTLVHDLAPAERHWKTLLDLFDRTLER